LRAPREPITLITTFSVEFRRPTRIAGIRPNAALVLLVVATASIAQAQSESLRSIASELAGTIDEASRQGVVHDPGVLVNDFAQTHGARTALGAKLADQFFKDLVATQGPGTFGARLPAFHIVDTDRSPSIPDTDLSVPDPECPKATPRADLVVDGYIDALPETIVLRIVSTRTRDKKAIFDERITFPIDAEMRSLLATPLPDPRPPPRMSPLAGCDRATEFRTARAHHESRQ
jgi:hypothetical protein